MSELFTYGPLSELATPTLLRTLEQCFVSPYDSEQTYLHRIGSENFRALYAGDRLAGGLSILPMGQWFGGRLVPTGGIASVGIAPEYRGSGAAIAMMTSALAELYDREIPLSTLYPAAQQLYRHAGYEQAGSYCTWKLAPANIRLKDRPLTVQALGLDSPLFAQLQAQQAPQHNGHLDRHSAIWGNICPVNPAAPVYAYCFGPEHQPEGYVIFSQQREQGTTAKIHDWVLLTPAAVQTFWAFWAGHRSQIDTLRWQSAPSDLLTLLLPEQIAHIVECDRWMLRILDAPRALALRGYPNHVEGELHLRLTDDLIPDNNGDFILTVARGQAQVTEGGTGAMSIDIRGLAPLYSGLFSPQQLQLAGRLEASAEAMAIATQLFAGSSPWMPDFF